MSLQNLRQYERLADAAQTLSEEISELQSPGHDATRAEVRAFRHLRQKAWDLHPEIRQFVADHGQPSSSPCTTPHEPSEEEMETPPARPPRYSPPWDLESPSPRAPGQIAGEDDVDSPPPRPPSQQSPGRDFASPSPRASPPLVADDDDDIHTPSPRATPPLVADDDDDIHTPSPHHMSHENTTTPRPGRSSSERAGDADTPANDVSTLNACETHATY